MIYQHIFHACLQVSDDSGAESLLFDPFLHLEMSKFFSAKDEIVFDEDEIRKANFTAIFISHIHLDHYDLKSLAKLKKDIPVYLYATQIKFLEYIERLGFKKVIQLKKSDTVKFNHLTVSCLDNRNDYLECAFHVSDGNTSLVNVVDITFEVDEAQKVVDQFGPIDCLIYPFQVLREFSLVTDVPNLDYEEKTYAKKIELIKILNPKILIPGSCQFKLDQNWKNDLFFYKSRKEFIEDITKTFPGIQTLPIDSGEGLRLSAGGFEKISPFQFVQIKKFIDYHFNPETKLPGVTQGLKQGPLPWETIEKIVQDFKSFLYFFLVNNPKFKEVFAADILWRLSIVESDTKSVHYDFHLKDKTMVKDGPESADLTTTVAGEILLDFMKGEASILDFCRMGHFRVQLTSQKEGSVPQLLWRIEDNLFASYMINKYIYRYLDRALEDSGTFT